MAKPRGLSDDQLGAIIAREIAQAKDHDRTERQNPREEAIEYFLGVMNDTPSDEGRSSVVSRDVADVIGWIMPGLMRVFTASDQMAEAEACISEQEAGNPQAVETALARAKEATYGINQVFWKDNPGYRTVYDASWDALLIGNGVIKTYWEDQPDYETAFLSGLNDDQLALLLMPDENGDAPEVLAQTDNETIVIDQASGQTSTQSLHDVKIRRKKNNGKLCVECIPPEEFLIDADAVTTVDAAFKAHWQQKRRGELVEMGFDPEKIKSIPLATKAEAPEEVARLNDFNANEAPDRSTELVDFFECYIRVDVDGDDVPEMVRAYAAGPDGLLLDWEVWEDDDPFDDIPCEPMPHRWDARSVFDETRDVQQVKTVMLRQGFDNIYATNNPQRLVAGKVLNPQELINPSFGGTVFGDQNTTVTALGVPFVANHAFDALNYEDQVIQRRTGVSRMTMALDPEALQNQSATANQNEHDASYSQIELLARNMAELGWVKVFRKILRLLTKHQKAPRAFMLRGKPVTIDPRYWNADMSIDINIGLGTGSRERDMMMLGQILQQQTSLADRYIGLGAIEMAIDLLPKIIDTMLKFAEAGGIKNPEQFYPPMTNDVVMKLREMAAQRSQQPDPKMQIEQMKAQSQERIQASEMQSNLARAQAEVHKAQADAQVKLVEAQAKARQAEMQQALAVANIQLEQMKGAASNQTVLIKAQIDNAVRLAIAEITASKDSDPEARAVASDIDRQAGVGQQ